MRPIKTEIWAQYTQLSEQRNVFLLRNESPKVIFVQYPDITTYKRISVVQRALINFTRNDLWGDVGVLFQHHQAYPGEGICGVRCGFLPFVSHRTCCMWCIEWSVPSISTISRLIRWFLCIILWCINWCHHLRQYSLHRQSHCLLWRVSGEKDTKLAVIGDTVLDTHHIGAWLELSCKSWAIEGFIHVFSMSRKINSLL